MLSAGRWGKLAYNQIQDDGRPQHGVPKLLKRVFLVFVYYLISLMLVCVLVSDSSDSMTVVFKITMRTYRRTHTYVRERFSEDTVTTVTVTLRGCCQLVAHGAHLLGRTAHDDIATHLIGATGIKA